jgi:ATP-dependent DNA helicase RecG
MKRTNSTPRISADRWIDKPLKHVVSSKKICAWPRSKPKAAATYRKALVNAVAHRDYAIYGAKTRLRLFSDRLEIYSPGTLANTMTVESLPYRQAARNEALTSLLAKCSISELDADILTDRRTLMDKRGEGVQIILDNSERLSGTRPEYRTIDDSELLLIIHAARVP